MLGGFLSALILRGRGALNSSKPFSPAVSLSFGRQPHDIGHFRSFKWRPSRASAVQRYNGYSIHKRIRTGRAGIEILLRKMSRGDKYIAQFPGIRWKKYEYSPLLRFRPDGAEVSPDWKPMRKAKDYVRFIRPDPLDSASTKRTPHGYYFDYTGEGKRQKKMPPIEADKFITAVDIQYPYKPTNFR